MNRHIKRHTGEKKYACDQCDARFIQNSQLKNHMRIHDESISFDCKICGEKCKTNRALAIHRRKAHQAGVTYKCGDCGKVHVTRSELVRHVNAVHLKLKEFGCEVCGKRFGTKSQALVHNNIHNTEPPVKCKLCGAILLRKDCYRRHIKERHYDAFKTIVKKAEQRKVQQFKAKTEEDDPDPAAMQHSTNDNQIAEPDAIYHIVDVENGGRTPVPITEADGEIVYEVDFNPSAAHDFNIPDDIADTWADSTQETVAFEGLADHMHEIKVSESLNFKELLQYTTKLLESLLDASTLAEFNHPNSPIDIVLEQIIENCGSETFKEPDGDKSTEIRENIKKFFSLVMESKYIQELLNNYSVDEVVQYIVKYLTAEY